MQFLCVFGLTRSIELSGLFSLERYVTSAFYDNAAPNEVALRYRRLPNGAELHHGSVHGRSCLPT